MYHESRTHCQTAPSPTQPRTNTLSVTASHISQHKVHWATMVDANNAVTHYVNGTVSTLGSSSTSWCGVQGGALVLGHDQDSVGGTLDANQAPNIVYDSIRVHNVSLSQSQITAIASGGSPGSAFWSECEH
jgi:hypothetical protein